jgi:hypothetical protein
MLEAFIVQPQRHEHLTFFPVLAEEARELPYRLLEDALTAGDLTIEGGRWRPEPWLVAHNRGPEPVLILNGERLAGGGRACMTSHSMLVAPRAATEFPVALVSRGGGDGQAGEEPMEGPGGSRYTLDRRQLTLSRHPGADLEEWVRAFPVTDRQIGILVFLGPKFLGMDTLGAPSLYRPVHQRLLAGYFMAARATGDPPQGRPPPDEPEAIAFATALEEARRIPTQTVGLGTYSVFRGLVRGGELLHDHHLVHLSVFPLELEKGHSPSRLTLL